MPPRPFSIFDVKDDNISMSRCVTVDEEEPFAMQKRAYIRAVLVGFTVLLLMLSLTYCYCRSSSNMKSIQQLHRNNPNKPHTSYRNEEDPYTIESTAVNDRRRKNGDFSDNKGDNNNNNGKTNKSETNSDSKAPKNSSADNVFEINDPVNVVQNYGDIVLGATCRIPNISATDESIVKYVKKLNYIQCSPNLPLTEVYYDTSADSYAIRIIKNNAPPDIRTNKIKLRCCFSVIIRKHLSAPVTHYDDHNRFNISSPSICFYTTTLLPATSEFIYVECKTTKHDTNNGVTNDEEKTVYKNVHAVVRVKPELLTAAVNKSRHTNSSGGSNDENATRPNVLIVGIDSTSRLSMLRSMPLTTKYLNDSGWYELIGYNKVADDAFQNLVPLLTGMNQDQLIRKCWKSPFTSLDDCPFIWKDYKNQSYVTAFAEDQSQKSAFNLMKYGFFEAPTDYYPRAFVVAAERQLLANHHGGLKYCLGPMPASEHVLRYAIDFAKTFSTVPHFGLFWMDTFTAAEDLKQAPLMDGRMRRFFRDLTPYLKSTFVIFLSDHGARHGPLRRTFAGWLEERTPFAYIWVPPYFRSSNQQKYQNLLINRNRLISTYDIYLTLRDILNSNHHRKSSSFGGSNYDRAAIGCPKCSSLFDRIKWNRTCKQAGISAHWCICEPYFDNVALDSDLVRAMVEYVVNDINQLLRLINAEHHFKKLKTRCARLAVKKIISARRKKATKRNNQTDYVIVFKTKPNNAIYEATVRRANNDETDNKDRTFFRLIDTVSRLNYYNVQSQCVTNTEMLKYCMCVMEDASAQQNDKESNRSTLYGNQVWSPP